MVEVMKSCDVNVFGRGIIENVCDFAMTHARLFREKHDTNIGRLGPSDDARSIVAAEVAARDAIGARVVSGSHAREEAARRNKGTHAPSNGRIASALLPG